MPVNTHPLIRPGVLLSLVLTGSVDLQTVRLAHVPLGEEHAEWTSGLHGPPAIPAPCRSSNPVSGRHISHGKTQEINAWEGTLRRTVDNLYKSLMGLTRGNNGMLGICVGYSYNRMADQFAVLTGETCLT